MATNAEAVETGLLVEMEIVYLYIACGGDGVCERMRNFDLIAGCGRTFMY
jgi:hypothetical protein